MRGRPKIWAYGPARPAAARPALRTCLVLGRPFGQLESKVSSIRAVYVRGRPKIQAFGPNIPAWPAAAHGARFARCVLCELRAVHALSASRGAHGVPASRAACAVHTGIKCQFDSSCLGERTY